MVGIVSAPSNLGLRPPEPTAVPGTARAPEALREAGLYDRLMATGAVDSGTVLPGRYVDDKVAGSSRVRNQDALVAHTRRLGHRLDEVTAAGRRPLVIGGDCSILLGAGLHLRQRGRFGLVHIDGHTDFRHPGNSGECASVGGEDLAAAIGLHWPAVSDIDGLGPYWAPADVVHVGCRDDDEDLAEVRATIASTVLSSEWIADPGAAAAVIDSVVRRADLDGFWIHLDVDVLDPGVMPAVDSPEPGGLDPHQLADLLAHLWTDCAGLDVTIFDPDLDPSGDAARLLTEIITSVLGCRV